MVPIFFRLSTAACESRKVMNALASVTCVIAFNQVVVEMVLITHEASSGRGLLIARSIPTRGRQG